MLGTKVFILGKLKGKVDKVMGCLLLKKLCFKGFGKMIWKLKGYKLQQLVNIKVNSKMNFDKGKDSFSGHTVNIILGNGKKVRKMAVDIGNL